jgi:O-antigen/teichoic acid export membrane protein
MKEKKRIAPRFLGNSLYNFTSMGITNLGSIIFTIIIARILSPENFGAYTLALSIVLIFLTIGDFGLNESLVRYVSLNSENKAKAKTYFAYLLKIKVFLLLGLSLILLASSRLISSFYNQESLVFLLVVGSLYLFFYSLMQFISSFFYSLNNLKAIVYKDLIFNSLRLLLIPTFYVLSFVLISSLPIIFAAAAALIGVLFNVLYLFHNYKFVFTEKRVKINERELFHFSKYLAISSISVLFLVYTDILILGKFVDFEIIGFYRAASSIALLFASIINFAPMLYPFLARLDKKRIQGIFNILIKYIFILAIPIIFGTIFLSKYFVTAIFGYSYLPSVIPLYCLIFLTLAYPLGELFRSLLNSKGYSRSTAISIAIASVLNIVLNLILIKLLLPLGQIYAAVGSAIATLICRLFIFFYLARLSNKKFGINIKYYLTLKPIFASIIMSIFLFYFTKQIYGKANILLGILGVLIAMIVYAITLYLIRGFSKGDINYLKGTIRDLLKKD